MPFGSSPESKHALSEMYLSDVLMVVIITVVKYIHSFKKEVKKNNGLLLTYEEGEIWAIKQVGCWVSSSQTDKLRNGVWNIKKLFNTY